MARAAAAIPADGIMVEVHDRPDEALSDALGAEIRDLGLAETIARVIERTGLRTHYEKEAQKDRSGNAESRLENLDELINAARSFENDGVMDPEVEDMDPLTAFLSHASLEAGERQAGEGEDCVQLMTLHSAKGLEFPLVFMVGLEQGLFPHARAIEEGGIEEERRLCYVGMTRAREKLFLSHAELRRMHGSEQSCLPSRFLREIDPACMVELRPRAGVRRPLGGPRSPVMAAPRRPQVHDNSLGGFRLGQTVRHPKFGEGTILAFDGDGERARVEVQFEEAGHKVLMLAYAKLQPL